MKTLVERYRINESYSLQEYDGKIRDAIISEIKDLNKIAVLVCLFLYKFKLFMTTRTINDGDLHCSLMLIYYDRDSGKPNKGETGDSDFVGPDMVDGATAVDKVFVYVPVSLDTAPFATEYMNEYCHNSIYKGCSGNLKLFDGMLHCNNYDSIESSTKKLKQKYDSNVAAFIDSLPEECAHAKKTLNIDINYVFKTVKHEFTHVLDQTTASRINHFTGIGIDDVNKRGLDLALNILYMLWSRTEFNAFTQTFGRDIDKPREAVRSKYINKVSQTYLSRPCSDGGTIDLDEALDDIYESLNELCDSEYDDEFWDVIRNIVIDGSADANTSDRFEKMTPLKFRNYFIRTSLKLIEKFREKLVKNIAAQNTYDRDISNIAAEIKDECNRIISEYEKGDSIEMDFNFDCYVKKQQESYKVYVNIETPDFGRDRLNDSMIAGNSMIHITVSYLNIGWDLSPRKLFGNDSNSYCELYKEIISKQRKSKLDRLCINFAEDLNRVVNVLVCK